MREATNRSDPKASADESRGYVFILNSTKPSPEQWRSRAAVDVTNFSRPWLEEALARGYTVHLGVNRRSPEGLASDLPIRFYDSSTYRSILDVRANLAAVWNLFRLLRGNSIELIHCNTPIGGVVGRICGALAGVPTLVYSAHGFHFYQGAPRIQAAVSLAVERLLARWTDAVITMNSEDYAAAKRFRLKPGGTVHMIHGVGIDVSSFDGLPDERAEVRAEIGLPSDAVLAIMAGDLVKRKNVALAVEALGHVDGANVHLVLCGQGREHHELNRLADSIGVSDRVHFLGVRRDMPRLLNAADILVHTSFQEGLPRAVMEGMAAGLPLLLSDIRGNRDLRDSGARAILVAPDDPVGLAQGLTALATDPELRESMGRSNQECAQLYDSDQVRREVATIYQEILGDPLGGGVNAPSPQAPRRR